MPIRHRLLAIVVAVLWGANFIAIHASLEVFPPFLCAALRFLLLAVPTVLLVPRPQVPTRWLVGYGIGFGILQFAFLYLAMDVGMPAGLASLVLQSSAPFTVVLGAVLLGERLSPRAAAGVGVAALGMAVVGSQRLDAQAGLLPFVLTLLAGLGWAFGNLASRLAAAPRPLHLTMWMTVIPPLPLLLLSLLVEGPDRITAALADSWSVAAIPAWLGLAYTTLLATVLGSGIWTWLMARHPSGTVAPFSMLVPVTGLALAWLVLGEVPAPLELVGGVLVVGGVLWASRTVRAKGTPGARGGDIPSRCTRSPSSTRRSVRPADDLALLRHPDPVGETEGERHPLRPPPLGRVTDLQVEVRLGGVAGVAALPEHLTVPHGLPHAHPHAALPQVGEHDDVVAHPEDDVVAGERVVPLAHPAGLGQGIGHEGEGRAPRLVVRLAVVDEQHLAGRRRQELGTETDEPLGRLGRDE